jgi:hypothetical protein
VETLTRSCGVSVIELQYEQVSEFRDHPTNEYTGRVQVGAPSQGLQSRRDTLMTHRDAEAAVMSSHEWLTRVLFGHAALAPVPPKDLWLSSFCRRSSTQRRSPSDALPFLHRMQRSPPKIRLTPFPCLIGGYPEGRRHVRQQPAPRIESGR